MSVTAPDDAFLDVNDAHLRVFGNVHADGLKLGQLEVVTTTSTGSTIQFLHQHTAFTTTSNIEVGTTNHDLFVDTNTSRVGILTNTPTTALDVNGTVRATAFDGDGALLTGIPSSAINGTLSQWTTVTGPKIHYSDGNVGIGIADPLHTLDVVGDINFTGTLREDGNPFVSTPWTIETSPTALSYTGGNVGIGAATPSAKLEVTGNAHVTTDLSVGGTLSINTITAAATHALSAVTAVGASTGDTLQLTNATTGLVTTGNVEVGKDLTVAGNVAVDTDTLFVDSVNNRVGVGTTIPSHALTVAAASGDAEVHIQAQGNDGGDAILYFNGSPTNQRKCAIISSNVAPNAYCKQDLHFCMETTNDLSDVDITDSKMVITNDGNLGIGTTDPLNILHLSTDNASLDASGSATFDQYSLIIHNTRGSGANGSELGMCFNHYDSSYPSSTRTPGAAITHERIDSWSKGKLHFKTKSGNTEAGTCDTRMTIDESGNVGIGTTSPSQKLDVNGGISATAVSSTGGFVTTTGIQISMASGSWYNVIDFRSYRYAWKRMFIAGYRYGYTLGGNATFYVVTDTGNWYSTLTQEYNNAGLEFRVSGNYIQAKQSWYLGNTENLIFRVVSLT